MNPYNSTPVKETSLIFKNTNRRDSTDVWIERGTWGIIPTRSTEFGGFWGTSSITAHDDVSGQGFYVREDTMTKKDHVAAFKKKKTFNLR